MLGKHHSLNHMLKAMLFSFSVFYFYFSVSTHLTSNDKNTNATYLMFIIIMTKPLGTCIIHNFVSQWELIIGIFYKI